MDLKEIKDPEGGIPSPPTLLQQANEKERTVRDEFVKFYTFALATPPS